MTEKNYDQVENNNLEIEESKLSFDDKVIAKISKIAVNKVDGILDMKGNFFDSVSSVFGSNEKDTAGVDVEVGEKQAKVNMQIILEYGKSAPQIFEQIKIAVRENVKAMTGLDVVTINVDVVDVLTRQEYQKRNKENNEDR